LSTLSKRPIIILGAARSGTKLLRDTLGASPEAAVVPYDMNFVWRTGNEISADDAIGPAQCTEQIAHVIQERLRAAATPRDPTRRLIEKTVSNTVRVPFVACVFPDADFVHIVRDGRDVVESSLRQWQAPVDWRYLLEKARSFPIGNYRYALWYLANRLKSNGGRGRTRAIWGARYPGIEEDLARMPIPQVCARQWVESVEGVRQAAPGLARFREIRYEDLIAGPDALTGLVEWLKLSGGDAVADRYRASVQRRRAQPWDRGLAPADARGVLEILSPSLRKLGYN